MNFPPIRPAFSPRHVLPSLLCSAEDDVSGPDSDLVRLALEMGRVSLSTDLKHLSQRLAEPPWYPEVWPGEHYKPLAALVQLLQPRLVLEIGTATGLSALAMKAFLPSDGCIITFDIIPWREYPGCILRESDFADGRLQQVIADLSEPALAAEASSLLRSADLLFIDAAKDGQLEYRLWENFMSIGLKSGAHLVFDDIRMMDMLALWRGIRKPKMDVTSLGHWSGTGIVRWTN